MKKLVYLVLVVTFLLSLGACSTPADTESNISNSHEKIIEEIINMASVLSDQPEGDGKFFEDDTYIYSFSFPMSDWVYVYYTDGTKEDIKTALENGHIKITDLDTFGIGYWKESHKVALD